MCVCARVCVCVHACVHVCVRACVRACVRVCVCCHGKGYLEHLNVLQVQGVFWPRRDDVSRAAAGQTRVLESGTR